MKNMNTKQTLHIVQSHPATLSSLRTSRRPAGMCCCCWTVSLLNSPSFPLRMITWWSSGVLSLKKSIITKKSPCTSHYSCTHTDVKHRHTCQWL